MEIKLLTLVKAEQGGFLVVRPDMFQQYGPGMASYQPTFAGTLVECLRFMEQEFSPVVQVNA